MSIERTLKHVRQLISDSALNHLSTIILVGGFAECELVQNAFKRNFGRQKIIIPEEGGLAILKGAVLSGHVNQLISSRIALFTYGIDRSEKFNPDIHPIEKRIVCDGIARCTDVFTKVVEIGEVLEVGHTVSRTGRPATINQNKASYRLYTSSEKSPQFVTDPSCRLLGTFSIPLPAGKTRDENKFEMSMIFGHTGIIFSVKCDITRKEFKTYFTFE
ncbi:hypothetical protein ACJMK2_035710 [Sinanodonta woodiana]|uniref:Uncharacterized protein n=1 Tax=Sinanodonta woodiana TaxID=1069815 RepID=A0ABD3WZ86_SINWO